MKRRSRLHLVLASAIAAALLASACAPTPSQAPLPGAGAAKPAKGDTPAKGATPADTTPATPVGVTPALTTGVRGRVLGLDGQPAVGVRVRGFLAGGADTKLIGMDGSSLIGQDGGSLIGMDSSSLIGKAAQARRLLAAGAEVKTDADGRFTLTAAAGETLNVEAVEGDGVKAIQLGVAAGGGELALKLAPTGTIAGTLSASLAGVTDFEGVDVFVPGTGYLAKADKAGRFTIAGVATGTFTVVATRAGLGRAAEAGVAVPAGGTATLAKLVLQVIAPKLKALSAAVGAAGMTLTLTGEGFGLTAATPFQVTIGGVGAEAANRKDDTSITVRVPAGAANGEVVVAVGGVPGPGLPFKVVKALSLAGNPTLVAKGALPAVFAVVATDAAGVAVAAAPVIWSVEGAAAQIDAAGALTGAIADGTTVTVKATLGDLTATQAVRVVTRAAVVETVAKGAVGAPLAWPGALAVAPDGTVYVQSDGDRIQAVKPDGSISTLTDYGDIVQPRAIARAADGTLYAVDSTRQRIVKIDAAGQVTAIAGSATSEVGHTDGTGADARFTTPAALALDGTKLYVADDATLRLIDLAQPGYPVKTIAGDGIPGTADGPGATARLAGPVALVVAGDTLYMADFYKVRRIKLAAGGQATVSAVAGAESGYVDGAGGVEGPARFGRLGGLALKGDNLFVSDRGNHRIRLLKLTADGGATVSTIAGSGKADQADGEGLQAAIGEPIGIGFDGQGRLTVAGFGGHTLRRITFVGEP